MDARDPKPGHVSAVTYGVVLGETTAVSSSFVEMRNIRKERNDSNIHPLMPARCTPTKLALGKTKPGFRSNLNQIYSAVSSGKKA